MKHMKKILLLILLGLIVQLPLGAFDKNSLYQMPIKFKNQKNETVSLGQFSGQKTVLALFFSSCQYACPLILAEMKKIEKSLLFFK